MEFPIKDGGAMDHFSPLFCYELLILLKQGKVKLLGPRDIA